MIIETGRVASIEQEGLWVETVQRSTCGACAAQKGCGQSLLARLAGHSPYLWVPLQGRNAVDFSLHHEVKFGIPEAIVANGSMLVYLLPLVVLVAMTAIADALWQHEGVTIFAATLGLLLGGGVVRILSYISRNDIRFQPVIVDGQEPITLLKEERVGG